ncbi:MAG TPA: MBG domain-containing protein, partial [Puia sp.]|nr:MBG domain-containing protein [Puia sp.]
FKYVNGTLTVAQAALTITAGNQSMTYGGVVPALTASYSGFVNGDNSSDLTTAPTISTTATSASPAGSYPTTASGAVDPNYIITYQTGTLTVGKASLTVTADNKGMPLGGPLPAFTVSFSGFLNGDGAASLSTQPTATTKATAASPAGNYPITPSGGVSPNYSFKYVNGTLTVAQAVLTITANPASSIYGAPLVGGGSLTVSYSGFQNGDGPSSLSKAPVVSNFATPGAPAGSYTLTPSGAVDPNYAIVYATGVYTIRPASLTIAAVNQSMTYGGAVPALGVTYTGFVNGDKASGLSTQPTVSTTGTSSAPAGTYPITASGASDPNYTISYSPGTLTINPAALSVVAAAQKKVFGTPDPVFTYTATGYLNGDNSGIFSGSLGRTAGENVGVYPITIGSLSAGNNYTIRFTGNNLTITIGSQTITWTQSLIVGCNATTQVQLNATASSGLPVTYTVANSKVASVSGSVLTLLQPGTTVVTARQAGDANHTAAPAVTDTVFYQAASLISQHWNDALFFDNSSDNYVAWQWYKNDSAVAGATDPYYSEEPALNGRYFVIATNKDSQQVQSCTLKITPGAAIPGGIKVQPNPVGRGQSVTFTANYSTAALQGAVLQVVDLTGKVRQQLSDVQPSMQVTMPSDNGIFIINLLLASGAKASVNVLVANQ